MERATVLVIDVASGKTKARLEKDQNLTVVGATDNLDIGFTLSERYQPTVILLNVDLAGGDGLNAAEIFAIEFPASSLILMTKSESGRVLRHALRVGAREVITLPVEPDRLVQTVSRVIKAEYKRRQVVTVQRKKRPQFKTITFFSTKGGVGKTTLALNTAIAIQQATNKRVALVDLNLYSGNLALLAGIPWRRSIKDLVDEINNLDEEMLDSYCAKHPSGVRIIPAPIISEYAAFILPEHIEKILKTVSQVFNYVIIDAPTSFHDTIIPALERSQEIVLVTTLDLAAIQCIKQNLILLKGLSFNSKIRLVVNKFGYTGGLKVKDIEDELGLKVQCTIPECEKIAVDAVNLGNPILLAAEKSSASQKIRELARQITTGDDGLNTELAEKNIS